MSLYWYLQFRSSSVGLLLHCSHLPTVSPFLHTEDSHSTLPSCPELPGGLSYAWSLLSIGIPILDPKRGWMLKEEVFWGGKYMAEILFWLWQTCSVTMDKSPPSPLIASVSPSVKRGGQCVLYTPFQVWTCADSRTDRKVEIQASNFGARETHTGIFSLPLPLCVTLNKSLNLSEPQSIHL